MSNCLYCNQHVIDDEDTQFDPDTGEAFHRDCEESNRLIDFTQFNTEPSPHKELRLN